MNLRYQIIFGAVTQRLGDEIVIVHPKTDRIFLLNRTGARIWELLSERLDLDDIQERLFQEFKGDRCQITQDIQKIVSSLAEERFISEVSRGSHEDGQ